MCIECGRILGHERRCPNYKEKTVGQRCSICDCIIHYGDKYIKNDSGDYAHWDCIDGEGHLLEWLGYCLFTMEY